jgi:hypothetical protein
LSIAFPACTLLDAKLFGNLTDTNEVVEIDAKAALSGARVDGAGFDPATSDAFASNADGTLTVIHEDSPDRYHVVENVETPQNSRNMGLDPTNHKIFMASAKFPAAPAGGGRGRPQALPGSFAVIVIERAPGR